MRKKTPHTRIDEAEIITTELNFYRPGRCHTAEQTKELLLRAIHYGVASIITETL